MGQFANLPDGIDAGQTTYGGSRLYVAELEDTSPEAFASYITAATGEAASGVTIKCLGRITEGGISYDFSGEGEVKEEDSLGEQDLYIPGSEKVEISIDGFKHTVDESVINFLRGDGATTSHAYFEKRYLGNDTTGKPEIYFIHSAKFGFSKSFGHKAKEAKKITGCKLVPEAVTGADGKYYSKYVYDTDTSAYVLDTGA